MSGPITLYTSIICPFAQRAAMTLKELGVVYESVEIDLKNKPDWYKDVNPDLKVPAAKVNGKSIAESVVLIELFNDLYPEKNLFPTDPIKRAQGRFAIEHFQSKILPRLYGFLREPNVVETYHEVLNEGYSRLNELLLEQSETGPYFYGEQFTLVDIALAPFVARFKATEKYFIKGQTPEIEKSAPRLSNFFKALLERPSFKETYCGDEYFKDHVVEGFKIPLNQA